MNKKTDKNRRVDKSESKIKELESKLVEMETNWKRALADYRNLEKRSQEEKSSLASYANRILIGDLLPVLDNFSMLENHTNDTGIKMTIKEFRNILKNAGLETIDVAPGRDFDPKLMDAVDSGQGERNKVLEVIRAGYLLKDALIRPASVKVGRDDKSHTLKGE